MSGAGEMMIFGVEVSRHDGRGRSTEIIRHFAKESDAVEFFKEVCLENYEYWKYLVSERGIGEISWERNRSFLVCNRATFDVWRSDDLTSLCFEYQGHVSKKKMEKPNVLLIPKFKERTHNTHLKHIAASQSGQKYRLAFLGDSLMERWLTTGVDLWTAHFANDCVNLGVGGDGIEHLLYRLKGTKEVPGCLDNIHVECMLLMIGTNNLPNKSVDHIFAGIMNVVNIVIEKQPQARIILYGLTNRKDVDVEKVTRLNLRLSSQVIYSFFGDLLNADTDYDDHVHFNALGYSKWVEQIK